MTNIYRTTILFLLLLHSGHIFSIEREFSIELESDYLQKIGANSYLADPLINLEYNNGTYSSYSPLSNWEGDGLWFSVNKKNLNYNPSTIMSSQYHVINRIQSLDSVPVGLIIDLKDYPLDAESESLFLMSLINWINFFGAERVELKGIDWSITDNWSDIFDNIHQYTLINELYCSIQSSEDIQDIKDVHWVLHFYDYSGKHCTLESVESEFYNLSKMDSDFSNMTLVIPTYGRKYIDSESDYWFGVKSYKEIISEYSPGISENQSEGYFFNGVSLLEKKVLFAQSFEIGRIRLSNINDDSSGEYSLWNRLKFLIP